MIFLTSLMNKEASWDDISELYGFKLMSSVPLLPKIHDEHIKPTKLKMKVNLATEIFSQTVGSLMLNCSSKNLLPHDFSATAEVLWFFNDLFDSLNGAGNPINGSLKGSINRNSIHFDYWKYALSMLEEMHWIDRITGKVSNRSKVLHKFRSTIKGYQEIVRMCLNLNMPYVSIRYEISLRFPKYNHHKT